VVAEIISTATTISDNFKKLKTKIMIQTKTSPNFSFNQHVTKFNEVRESARKLFMNKDFSDIVETLDSSELTLTESNVGHWYTMYSILHLFILKSDAIIDFTVTGPDTYENTTTGGYVKANELFLNAWLTKLTVVRIDSAYPKEILELSEKSTCSFSNFHDVLSQAKKMREYLKQPELSVTGIYRNAEMNIKRFVNMTYGMISSSECPLKFKEFTADVISHRIRRILIKIEKAFPGHCVYLDSDAMFFSNFHEIETRFHDTIKTMGADHHTYSVEHDKKGMVIGKKKYIIHHGDGRIEPHGIRVV